MTRSVAGYDVSLTVATCRHDTATAVDNVSCWCWSCVQLTNYFKQLLCCLVWFICKPECACCLAKLLTAISYQPNAVLVYPIHIYHNIDCIMENACLERCADKK